MRKGGGSTTEYICNGVNDNEILSQMSQDFLNGSLTDYASKKIIVVGDIGESGAWKYGDWTQSANPLSEWFLGVKDYTGNRKLAFDFSNAILKDLTFEREELLSGVQRYASRFNCFYVSLFGINSKFNAKITFNTGTGTSIGNGNGFSGSNCYISNCTLTGTGTGTATGYGYGYGFSGSNCYISNCILTGTGTTGNGNGNGTGFRGSNCYISNCTLTGTGNGTGTGFGFGNDFSSSNCYISNCTLTGTGTGTTGHGNGSSSMASLINCTLCALTPTGTNAVCIKSVSTSSSNRVYISGCTCAWGIKTGYNSNPANVTGIDLGTSVNVGVYCKGNFIHNEFTNKVTTPTPSEKCFVGDNNILMFIPQSVI